MLLIALNHPTPHQHSLSVTPQLLFLEAPAGVTVTLTILTGPCPGSVHTTRLWPGGSQKCDLTSKESHREGLVAERRAILGKDCGSVKVQPHGQGAEGADGGE